MVQPGQAAVEVPHQPCDRLLALLQVDRELVKDLRVQTVAVQMRSLGLI